MNWTIIKRETRTQIKYWNLDWSRRVSIMN
jgi:hypothetical protein